MALAGISRRLALTVGLCTPDSVHELHDSESTMRPISPDKSPSATGGWLIDVNRFGVVSGNMLGWAFDPDVAGGAGPPAVPPLCCAKTGAAQSKTAPTAHPAAPRRKIIPALWRNSRQPSGALAHPRPGSLLSVLPVATTVPQS